MKLAPHFDNAAQSASFSLDGQFNIIGVRAFITSCASIVDWMDDLSFLLGERFINARLYISARRAAKRAVQGLLAEFHIPNEASAKERFFAEFYAAIGWGKIDYQLDYANKRGEILVTNSFLAQGYLSRFTPEGTNGAIPEKSKIPRCALFGAYLAAQASDFLGEELEVMETECIAMGHPVCQFDISHERFSLMKFKNQTD